MKCCAISILIAMAISAGGALHAAPTPDAAWSQLLQEFTVAISTGDEPTTRSQLGKDAALHSFGMKAEDLKGLIARTNHGAVLGAAAYVHAPAGMAADIRSFFQKSKVVGEEVKRRFDPSDDDLDTANKLAVAWLEQAVGAKVGDNVGVIVLWCPKQSYATNSQDQEPVMEAVFVLVRAGVENSELRVQDVAFGNPVEETVTRRK